LRTLFCGKLTSLCDENKLLRNLHNSLFSSHSEVNLPQNNVRVPFASYRRKITCVSYIRSHLVFQLETRHRDTISGQMPGTMMQNSFKTTTHDYNDDDDDDDGEDSDDHVEDARDKNHEQYVECYAVESRVGQCGRCQPWIKHVGRTQHHDSEATSSAWMATLLHSLRFRLVDNNNNNNSNVPLQSHSRRPPSQCLVYVLDSDLQPTGATSGSGFKPETGNGRSASVVSQSQNEVESPTLKNLPDLTSSSCSSSLRTVSNSRQRVDPRAQSDVTSASPAVIYPKPNCLQSPPLAARYPRRKKIQTAGSSTSLGAGQGSHDNIIIHINDILT